MEVAVGTMQMTLYGNYAGDYVCWIYAGFEVVRCYWYVGGSFRYTGDSFCCNYTVALIQVFAGHTQATVSAANMWGTIFVLIMQMELSVAIMQGVCSAVYYADGCSCCNCTGDSFFYSHVGDGFKL